MSGPDRADGADGFAHSVRRSESTADLGVDLQALQEKVLRRFLALFSKVAKIDADRIDPEEALERYGIDSVMVSQLNLALNGIFGEEIPRHCSSSTGR
ncbi:acyl carrier protein [Variovorax sp. NFACC26]|uniref:acyl carrier protein n=1 Tax=Variovorax sp. NFACC26 TaxID=1566275 RepID=UPI003AB0BE19